MSDQVPSAPSVPKVPARKVAEGANLAGPVDVPLRHQLFLAIDYGQKRTGVASGNRITQSASPQPTIKASGEAQLLAVVKLVKAWQPDALVVGIPFHPDGAAHENTKRARKFANRVTCHRCGDKRLPPPPPCPTQRDPLQQQRRVPAQPARSSA